MWWSCPAFKIVLVWFKPQPCNHPPTVFFTLSFLDWDQTEFSFQNNGLIMLLICLCAGAATDMIAVMEMQNFLAAIQNWTSIGGPVRTRQLSVVLRFLSFFCFSFCNPWFKVKTADALINSVALNFRMFSTKTNIKSSFATPQCLLDGFTKGRLIALV